MRLIYAYKCPESEPNMGEEEVVGGRGRYHLKERW